MSSRSVCERPRVPRDLLFSLGRPIRYRRYFSSRARNTFGIRDRPFRRPEREESSPSVQPPKPEPPKPEETPVPEVELATKLHVTGVDLHISENVAKHKTDMYACVEKREYKGKELEPELVIRRGQTFKMTIIFDRPYDIKKNDVTLVFSLVGDEADREDVSNHVRSVKVIEQKGAVLRKRKWGAAMLEKKDKSLSVAVFIPASSAVGEWTVGVRTTVDVKDAEDIVWEYKHDQDIRVLFNPWCPEDLVYLENEEWVKEAVLNDSGCIYFGGYTYIEARKWEFGQFEEVILDAALYLLRKAFEDTASAAMGNVVRVVRALSSIVNSNDDNGVLSGNWSGNYAGGTSPEDWEGSIKILRQYMETGYPVRYGQCWVFSGVLTTVCRALGIPCRSVTNYESAHNSDAEHLSCDTVNKKYGDKWYEEEIDSAWNYHVWNEAWMSRPDLETGDGDPQYTGWQAIDATPQERSDGVFQCGPCPVKAIKEGQLNIGTDTAFVYAEVNGDKVEWKECPKTGILLQVKREEKAIGKFISTHKPTGEAYKGVDERLDVTDEYKYKEGSEMERKIFWKAERMFRFANCEDEAESLESFEAIGVSIAEQECEVGKPFNFKVTTTNLGDLDRTISLSLVVNYKNYRGKTTDEAATKELPPTIMKPREKIETTIDIDLPTSIERPQDGFRFKLNAVAEVKESGSILKESRLLILKKPELQVKGPAQCSRQGTMKATVTFTNTMSMALTDCELHLEGGLLPVSDGEDTFQIGTIKAGETFTKTVELKPSPRPRFRPYRDVVFRLKSKELGRLHGSHGVDLYG